LHQSQRCLLRQGPYHPLLQTRCQARITAPDYLIHPTLHVGLNVERHQCRICHLGHHMILPGIVRIERSTGQAISSSLLPCSWYKEPNPQSCNILFTAKCEYEVLRNRLFFTHHAHLSKAISQLDDQHSTYLCLLCNGDQRLIPTPT
jgi:hypothetical protein